MQRNDPGPTACMPTAVSKQKRHEKYSLGSPTPGQSSRPQAQALKLDDAQRRALAGLRRLFLRNFGVLVARRQKISAMLQVLTLAAGHAYGD